MTKKSMTIARRLLFRNGSDTISDSISTDSAACEPSAEKIDRPFRVLSIDGGGIRGILPAMLLAELERRAKRPIVDLFDMIVGTSTGGLLGMAVACPDKQGRPRHSARDVVRFYEVAGPRVFSRSVWHKIRAIGNLTEGKYPSSGIESVLDDYFGDARLKDALCDVIVPAYEIERRFPFFFKASKARRKDYYDYPMKTVLRAATAAPTYFEPAQIIIDGPNDYYALVDGALFAYNPGMCAYVEVLSHYPQYQSMIMVSLGTGEMTRRLPIDEVKDWGAARWAQPVFSLMNDGICDVVDYQLRQLLPDSSDGHKRYYRFQVRLDVGNDDMDDASSANLRTLKMLGADMLEANRKEIKRLAARLSAYAPPAAELEADTALGEETLAATDENVPAPQSLSPN